MDAPVIKLDCDAVTDWVSFHDIFSKLFGFPAFYGRNMDAWIDCMTSLDSPQDGLTTVHCIPGSVVTLQLHNAGPFRARCPEQYDALIECTAFVNWRRNQMGAPSVLALSYDA